jgi:2-polyprenyl-3-methyl-5-hydroxy-6-metoxy-1,4-benzoquinol methylase
VKVRYDEDRAEMVPFVPPTARRILDVGCSTGRFGLNLRAARAGLELWGIDPSPHPGTHPQPYDSRITGFFPQDLPRGEDFDCIVFNDVLEHLVDPWETLRTSRLLVRAGGSVVASIPNVRHGPSVVAPLLLRGRWSYREYGILDRTHLRFFTRSTIVDLFACSGYQIQAVEPIRIYKKGWWARVNRLTRGRFTDLLAERYAIRAVVT